MEEKIKQIMTKVRDMYKYMNDYSAIFKNLYKVIVCEEDGQLVIKEVVFGTYDKIYVDTKKIFYIPQYVFSKVLIQYNVLDELFSL